MVMRGGVSWHKLFHAFIRRSYFSRIRVFGAERVPPAGPVLAVCLHRNGAVDGFVYRAALPALDYLIKASLRKNPLGRLFFDGLEVARQGDEGATGSAEVIDRCLAHLADGGWLGVFPEGTSKLGPRHLPFKSGAARIALRHLENGLPLTVLPLGIHYENAPAFRSRVEIVIGEPVRLDGAMELPTPAGRLVAVKRELAEALESVGVNFRDESEQIMGEKCAYTATLGTGFGYFAALKEMERGIPPAVAAAWATWDERARGRRVLRHQRVPLFPLRRPWAYVLALLLVAPVVVGGLLVNAPPLAVAWWAGRRIPDDTNVIALWRILTGVPLWALWWAGCGTAGWLCGWWWLPWVHLALSGTAVAGWYRLKKLAVVTWNGCRHPDLRPAALAVHRAVLGALHPSNHEPI